MYVLVCWRLGAPACCVVLFEYEDGKMMKAFCLMMLKTCLATLLGVLLAGTALADTQPGWNGSLNGLSLLGGVSVVSGGGLETAAVASPRLTARPIGTGEIEAGSQGFASRLIDAKNSTGSSNSGRLSIDFSWIPRPGTWMTLLAGIGFAGMMIDRTKRRYI